MSDARLIGVDWGSTHLRAYLFDPQGVAIDRRHRPLGLRQLAGRPFDAALDGALDGWPDVPVLAAGMVGSRQGWREVPYCDTPADAGTIVAHLLPVHSPARAKVLLVPGLRDPSGPDVMRGEETQLVGALADAPEAALFVLPGTHSKWARAADGRVLGFRTFMTGELFGLLRHHSLLGAGVPEPAVDNPAAFDQGVAAVRDSGAVGVGALLFSARALVLDDALASSAVPDYLSGLLIGEECRAARAAGWLHDTTPVRLLGDAALCARYATALQLFGCACAPVDADCAARGLWRIAQLAGL